MQMAIGFSPFKFLFIVSVLVDTLIIKLACDLETIAIGKNFGDDNFALLVSLPCQFGIGRLKNLVEPLAERNG